jgi:hypothetical protein
MRKKVGTFFEAHIEKIVIGLVGLVCIWILISRVFFSPQVVNFDNKKFSPGDIDNYISKQAELLEARLNSQPKPKQPYQPRFDDFLALLESPIKNIDVGLNLPQPIISSRRITDERKYSVPLIGNVSDISAEHIRAVAYVPTEQVNQQKTYYDAEKEPNDLDLVTVEAKFDVARLYESFYQDFAGQNVREQWRDPCIAKPVFAAVQLQRQQMLDDGKWGDWQIVPRARIDARRQMFEVEENVRELPAGGMKVLLLQFDDPQVQMDLLQPESYKIASAAEEWFPPSLHRKYIETQRQIESQEKRQVMEDERRQREKDRSDRRSRAAGTASRSSAAGGGMPGGLGMPGLGGGMPGGLGMPGPGGGMPAIKAPTRKRATTERRSEREREEKNRDALKKPSALPDDVYSEFEKILITEETDFARMQEPLVFWALDDTVEPCRCYRYRVRLGIFNPIAGTEQFVEQDKQQKDKAILWSEFSDQTEPVEIPRTLYFFPLDIQEAARTVTVNVCRYVWGYWYSRDFVVKAGEVIGAAAKSEQTEEQVKIPETIDYATGAVLVDVAAVDDWSGGKNLRARHYFEMLYSTDGTDIQRMAIKTRYWPDELQIKFNEIKKAEKEPKEPWRDWGGGMPGRPLPGMPGMPGMPPELFLP